MSSLEGQQLQKRLFTEIAFLSLLAIAALLPFTQTLFNGASISKVDLIKNFDAVQAQSLRSPFWLSDDLSASMAHIPNELFAAKHEGSSELPLWNHLNGAGRPFVGEFQTLRFSVFHWLFPAASSQLYNLGILAKIILAGIGAFLLSRYIGLTRWVAFAAAVAFAFCPHSLRFVELCDNYFFYPFFLLSFLCLAAKPSLLRASVTALLCGFGAYNMHPETFACGTIFSAVAGLLSFVWKSTASKDGTEIETRSANFQRLLPGVGWIGLVAVLTFLLSAPLVLTLAEFIANGESYKFADYKIDHIQASSAITDLFLPASAGSSYMGIVLGLSALAGVSVWARKNLALLCTFALVFLFTTRPGVLDPLLATPPLSFLLPEYSSYFMFILLALASATGLQSLVLSENLSRGWRNLALSISVVSALFMLFGNLSASSNFISRWLEFTPAELKFSSAFIPLSFALTLLFTISVLLVRSDAKLRTVFLAVFSVANSALLLYIAPLELGVHESFEFKSNPAISALQSLNSRTITTGYNLFQPNTNLIYGIDDFRTTAPLYPRRYARFQKLGGGGGRFFTIPDQSTELSKVFDLAAVRYVLSDRMISSAEESAAQFAQDYHPAVELPVKLADGLRLENASFAYDAKRKVLWGMAKFSVHKSAQTHYDCAFAIADEDGKALVPLRWLSERIEENSTPQGNHSFVKQFAIPVPNILAPGRKLQAALFIRNNWNSEMLGIGKSTAEQGLSLGSFAVGESVNLTKQVSSDTNNTLAQDSPRFVRHSDLPEGLFLFENKNALPPAYLIHKAELAADEKTSLKSLAEKKLDYSSTAIIECDPQYAIAQGLSEPSSVDKSREQARIVALSDDKVSVETVAVTPAFLILTQTYFPGWEATVDGRPGKILPANHMFRAVAVPAGKHQVEFVYKPASFAWGCRLLLSGLILLAGLLLKGALPFLSKSNAARGSDLQNQNSALETQSEVTQGR